MICVQTAFTAGLSETVLQPVRLQETVAMKIPGKPVLLRRLALSGLIAAAVATGVGACTPTVRLQVDPIQIYAKLDADVRVRLDQQLQDLLRDNPNLF
jgi:hypothetical protein